MRGQTRLPELGRSHVTRGQVGPEAAAPVDPVGQGGAELPLGLGGPSGDGPPSWARGRSTRPRRCRAGRPAWRPAPRSRRRRGARSPRYPAYPAPRRDGPRPCRRDFGPARAGARPIKPSGLAGMQQHVERGVPRIPRCTDAGWRSTLARRYRRRYRANASAACLSASASIVSRTPSRPSPKGRFCPDARSPTETVGPQALTHRIGGRARASRDRIRASPRGAACRSRPGRRSASGTPQRTARGTWGPASEPLFLRSPQTLV